MVIAMPVNAMPGNARAAMAIAAGNFVNYVYVTGAKFRRGQSRERRQSRQRRQSRERRQSSDFYIFGNCNFYRYVRSFVY